MSTLFDPKSIKVDLPTKVLGENLVKISVVGVGGGGCNMINHMINEGAYKIDLIVANTDFQALQVSKAPKKIQLGAKLTKGWGAGMEPEIGRDSALESYEEIKNIFNGSDIVFVAAGLGGGTGTGAAPTIVKAAKEVGALTVTVVTKPFSWEGKKRAGVANLGLEELRKVSDSIIIIPNDRLLEIADKDIGMKDAFKLVDNILYQAVNGMSEVILNPGNNDINVDFADIRKIMQHKGMALMGVGRAKGEDATLRALDDAIESPLLDKMSLSSARGVLIHFNVHPQVSLLSINNVMHKLYETVESGTADVIFGTTTDETLDRDEVKITIVATGFESKDSTTNSTQTEENKEHITINIKPDDEKYLDIPPLMREYIIKYSLKDL
ncbi:MAG: cell division protein FtsZ [Arcobacter butzleri]|jgi:cell division protein FtsZ|nr:cell division protein FtsZ [Arcobacteraceae bacterium]MDY0364429.1 cell division protein FtsZ [Arcobacteraceae bacterium]NLO17148.1 cell division protein FtsZ [Aliarcobacter butzleri]